MRSYLFAGGTDVTEEIINGSLVLSSANAHLVNGRCNIEVALAWEGRKSTDAHGGIGSRVDSLSTP